MNLSWKIFTAFGIPVRLHISMLLIPILAYSFAGDTGALGWLLVLALAVLLFGSILLHELGHALTGRRYGVHTEDIVLTPIGGMARMRSIPQRPKPEIVIALAGPLVSFALMGAFHGMAIGANSVPSLGLLTGLFVFLSEINFMLGAFNLIPALPMDGGRVFRGLLAMKYSHLKATKIAASVGKYLAIAGIAWGLIRGPWTLVAVGVFIFFSAGMEERVAAMQDAYRRAHDAGSPFGRSPFGGFPFGGRPQSGGRGYYVYQESRRSPSGTAGDDWKDGATANDARVVEGVKVEILSRKDPD
ncbi:MAG: site-2 protease family protein [Deltaproteobacteria bacterium]|nr:site-2 protease family protein [Deltaproteobacteria bacterium]